ncbi:outer membrane protein assembly factor BamD [Bacteroides sp. 214]|uniref:tetratricopeptide repeat protein n=1 Tax=Bacteroides sp. 214 TaxID=2302935 RepID=UPI0013D3B912|nr:tetratricopeptide repeat protein [Bacteroides sp. 214]NDW13291.1 outer membrane protein assembly factor BamD [Bacteroides sp. 214]
MKSRFSHLIFVLLCCVPCMIHAQANESITSPQKLFTEGRDLFLQKHYAAAMPLLQTYLNTTPESNYRMEVEYMLVCTAYELKDKESITLLETYMEKYPDTPYSNRLYALMASTYFFQEKYDEAVAMFNSSDLSLLANDERDEMTYNKAVSYMAIGNIKEAAIWFRTLQATSGAYQEDAQYYLAYIQYMQGSYDEALKDFLPLQNHPKYKALVPYYIAEIYLLKGQYDKAEIVAQNYLSAYSNNEHTSEMYRILGEAYYYWAQYHKAVPSFETYLKSETTPKRNALYMLGIAYYKTGVFSKAAQTLGRVTTENDALSQNAYLHMGLSYLELAEKNQARMAFQQAAASDVNRQIKEQAAYNYALCIHETSYSAFGESVTVFENFLNEFPNSQYTSQISNYLVEIYLNTRSYEAALTSIERIARPSNKILEAKQKILFQLGTEAFTNASFDKAITYFDQSIVLGRHNVQTQANACYWRGESYYRLNRLQDATRNFTDYLRLTSQKETEMYALAHYNLGYTAFQQKEYERARTWFDRYVKFAAQTNKETLADAYNRIADSYFHTRQFDNAKQYYALAEGMGTTAGDYSFYQLALVSGLQKDYAGKITLLNRLLGKYPSSTYALNAMYEKGRSYVLMENNQQAIASFSELLDKYPNSPLSKKAAAEIGLLYYQNGNYDKAIAAYKKVVTDYPGSEEARLALRDLKSIFIDMNRVNDFVELTATLPGDIRFDASEQDSLTYIAAEKVYMRGRVEEAKESFNKYLQSFPQGGFSLNAHYYLTLISKEQNKSDLVLVHTEKLLEYPDSPFAEDALIMRSEVLFNLYRYSEALVAYKQLKEKASTPDRRLLAKTGILRCAYLTRNHIETIHGATDLLAEAKLSPELYNEALYYRAKAYIAEKATEKATVDLRVLAKDTRTAQGAEAKYLVAQYMYDAGNYIGAEKELLNFIDQSTPHMYWLARGFVLLSDVYMSTGKELDARQYLLSLQQNYKTQDDIQEMIESRLQKLKNNEL